MFFYISQRRDFILGQFINIGYGKSTNFNPRLAVDEAVDEAMKQMGNDLPQYAYFFTTIDYDANIVINELNAKFNSKVKLHGLTSCAAVMTKDGYHQGTKGSLALILIDSANIQFGISYTKCDSVETAIEAGQNAIKQAIRDANKKEGEIPQFVILNASPGIEEKIIEGIQNVVGNEVPIVGGSCADNTIEGNWNLFCQDTYFSNGVVVTVGYSKLKIGYEFQNGYKLGNKDGIITKAEGRRIYEINHRPAGLVYNEWTDGAISSQIENGGNILGVSTFYPLSRICGKRGLPDAYLLSHPSYVTQGGLCLDLFTEVNAGEKIHLMTGTKVDLLRGTGSVMKYIFKNNTNIAGSIIIFCGGCMLGIGDKMPEVVDSINQYIGKGIFIGGFTFGEQGYLANKTSKHGNLMIATLTFFDERI
jgi:hypothetical protein